jgi:hypothetical protein
MAKLGETAKARINEQAKSMKDEDWDARLKELEEMAGVARDAKADGTPAPANNGGGNGGGGSEEKDETANGPTFENEEIASFVNGGGVQGNSRTGSESIVGTQRSQVVGALASSFKSKKS